MQNKVKQGAGNLEAKVLRCMNPDSGDDGLYVCPGREALVIADGP